NALYSTALAGFIRWLASQIESINIRLPKELADLRDQASRNGQHARTPAIIADLALGLRYFLDFARLIGAVSESEHADLWCRGCAALFEAADAQAASVATAEPAGLFLRLLQAAVASGRAHLTGSTG